MTAFRDGNLSESEAEMDGPHNEVILPQALSSRGNIKSTKSAIRQVELHIRNVVVLIISIAVGNATC